jgi:uncharacterized protein YjdB
MRMVHRKGALSVALAVCAIAFSGCSRDDSDFDYLYAGKDFSLAKGRTFEALAMQVNNDNSGVVRTDEAEWASSDPLTVEIQGPGVLFAKQVGVARITATYQGSTATFEVTVEPPVLDGMKVLAANDTKSILQDESLQFSFVLVWSDGERSDLVEGESIAWSTSSEKVATVDVAGIATGAGEGSASIIGKVMKGDKLVVSASRAIAVKAFPVGIELFPTTADLLTGRDYLFQTFITFSDGPRTRLPEGYALVWSSSDEQVAAVTNGLVSAVGEGTATIKVEIVDADESSLFSATSDVSVTSPVAY